MKPKNRSYLAIWIVLLTLFVLGQPAYAANEVKIAAGTAVPTTTPITLELKSADIRDVLQLMAKLGGINIVADQSVSGEVSVSLNEVPFYQALDMVVKANGFVYRWVGDVLLVASEERMVQALEEPVLRTFYLQHVDPAEAVAAIALLVDKNNIAADSGSQTLIVKAIPSQLTTIAKLIETLDVPKDRGKTELITKVFNLNHVDPELVVSALRSSLDPSVLLVPRNKAIVFRGTEAQLNMVAEVLKAVDQPELAEPVPQEEPVLAAVEEEPLPTVNISQVIRLNHISNEAATQALSLIIPAEAIKVVQPDRIIAIRGTEEEIAEALQIIEQIDRPAHQVLIEARVEEISVNALKKLGIDWDFSASGGIGLSQISDITNQNFSLSKIGPDVQAILKVLEESGDSRVLANPRIAVIDGEEASIHIGDRVPIVIDKKETDAHGNVVITTSVEYIDVGIMLDVLPRITSEGFITTTVKPEVSTIVGQTAQGYPQIRTRKANTRMTLANGETMVLGGLIQEEEIDTIKTVPVLSDLPLLGSLFKTTTKDTVQTEIVIFLTPTIIPVPAR